MVPAVGSEKRGGIKGNGVAGQGNGDRLAQGEVAGAVVAVDDVGGGVDGAG